MESNDGWEVTAIDNRSSMLEQCCLSNYITFLKRDVAHTELPSCMFDTVVTRHASWLFTKPETVYQEWFRLLKANGILLNLVANWFIPL